MVALLHDLGNGLATGLHQRQAGLEIEDAGHGQRGVLADKEACHRRGPVGRVGARLAELLHAREAGHVHGWHHDLGLLELGLGALEAGLQHVKVQDPLGNVDHALDAGLILDLLHHLHVLRALAREHQAHAPRGGRGRGGGRHDPRLQRLGFGPRGLDGLLPPSDGLALPVEAVGDPVDGVAVELSVGRLRHRPHHCLVLLDGPLLLGGIQAHRPVDRPQLGVVAGPVSSVDALGMLLLCPLQDIHDVVPAPLLRQVPRGLTLLGVPAIGHRGLDVGVCLGLQQKLHGLKLAVHGSSLQCIDGRTVHVDVTMITLNGVIAVQHLLQALEVAVVRRAEEVVERPLAV
mmetsp:Transcript_21186/g.59922  ORF Transcript_21186/g.59922 Transcript_21186/m.59922 type:complete len:346 (+) Transcript_21186:687-1724(+)